MSARVGWVLTAVKIATRCMGRQAVLCGTARQSPEDFGQQGLAGWRWHAARQHCTRPPIQTGKPHARAWNFLLTNTMAAHAPYGLNAVKHWCSWNVRELPACSCAAKSGMLRLLKRMSRNWLGTLGFLPLMAANTCEQKRGATQDLMPMACGRCPLGARTCVVIT